MKRIVLLLAFPHNIRQVEQRKSNFAEGEICFYGLSVSVKGTTSGTITDIEDASRF